MKEKAVRLSGVVYVKDPRDLEIIKRLREQVARRPEVRRARRAAQWEDG